MDGEDGERECKVGGVDAKDEASASRFLGGKEGTWPGTNVLGLEALFGRG